MFLSFILLWITRSFKALTIQNQKLFSPRGSWGVFVFVLMSKATCGLDVKMSVELINEHQVHVELLVVELQAQVPEPFNLQ